MLGRLQKQAQLLLLSSSRTKAKANAKPETEITSHKMAPPTPNIDLYTLNTPNGIKVSIALEELGLPYKTHKIDITQNTQKEPWFLEINPNGRIPAITDTFPADGSQIRLFESGSILQYLVDQYDPDHKISYPRGSREYYEMNSWLFFQNAGVGPMQGQANHFRLYAPENVPYGIKRYTAETRRLFGVLDAHLGKRKGESGSGSGWLAGSHVSIADITHWGWVANAGSLGIDVPREFPHLGEWRDRMLKRDGVEKGRHVPTPHTVREVAKFED